MSDTRKWTVGWALLLALACAPGEAPPEVPGPAVEEEPGPDAPVEEPVPGEGEEGARAAALLAEAQLAYERAELEEAYGLARRLLAEHGGGPSEPVAHWVAARSAFALTRYPEAGDHAAAYAALLPSSSSQVEAARELAALAEDAQEAPEPVVVGAVLPRTGPRVLVRYADWLLDGIRLALAEAERAQGRPIELVVADDSGGTRVWEAMGELASRGAVAVIGPLLPQHMASAAGARNGSPLVLVSPTATERPRWPETYSVNASDARGAQELGQYAADLGFTQAAVLYHRSPEYEGKARAFQVEFESMGGAVRAVVPYDSGTTTFASHMRRILAAVAPVDTLALDTLTYDTAWAAGFPAEPDTLAMGLAEPAPAPDSADPWYGKPPQEPFALFVPAPQRDVPQIAPQVAFYGLDSAGVQVFGDAAWATSGVRRVVPNRDLEGVLAASSFPPDRADAAADPSFVTAYEERYRRSYDGSNPLPALGYDAAHLVAQALPNRLLTPGAFARRFSLLAGIRGATGLLSVRAGRVVRTPYLVVIRNGDLAPAPYPWEYTLPVPTPPLPDSTDEEEVQGR